MGAAVSSRRQVFTPADVDAREGGFGDNAAIIPLRMRASEEMDAESIEASHEAAMVAGAGISRHRSE
jgi:hypothetical protein